MLASSVFSRGVFRTSFPQICSYFPPTGPSIKGLAVGAVELHQSSLTISYIDSLESFTVSKTLS